MRSKKATLIASRHSINHIDDTRLRKGLADMLRIGVGKTLRNKGWAHARPVIDHNGAPGHYTYQASILLRRQALVRAFSPAAFAKDLEDIHRRFFSAGRRHGWSATGDLTTSRSRAPDQAIIVPVNPAMAKANQGKASAERPFEGAGAIVIPADYQRYFAHLYNLDWQREQIMASLRTAKETCMRVRNHVVCWGPPGCGKSEMLLAVAEMLGPNGCKRLDATNTTKAGIVDLLMDLDPVPPVLILEELEKCHNEDNFSCLLGIMDDRGEITKTNARIGSRTKQAPCLVLSTVNDKSRFERLHDGALNDRHVEPNYFPMPDRPLLTKILLRDLPLIPGGKIEWVEPAIEYALNVEKTYAARRLRAIMTNGRDRLLTGEYQKEMKKNFARREVDQVAAEKFGIKM